MDSHLSNPTLRLDLNLIQAKLATTRIGKAPGWSNELWDCLDSTNTRAIELAQQGAPEGVIILARQQSAGRGRQGRSWISPPDSGIYASFIFRPRCPLAELPFHTLACGVATAKAVLHSTGLKLGLKWVNDLVFNGKKVGGILAEIPPSASEKALSTPSSSYAPLVLGIGINLVLSEVDIPEELKEKIDYLERIAGQSIDPNLLLASLAKELEEIYDILSLGHAKEILDTWKEFSTTIGKNIQATSGNTKIEGVAIDISESGGLILETSGKEKVVLYGGEITIRGADGSYI